MTWSSFRLISRSLGGHPGEKKADVKEHPEVFFHVGLFIYGRLGMSKLPLISSSDSSATINYHCLAYWRSYNLRQETQACEAERCRRPHGPFRIRNGVSVVSIDVSKRGGNRSSVRAASVCRDLLLAIDDVPWWAVKTPHISVAEFSELSVG